MTTWAIQPSHWGNQVLIGAEFRSDFATAEDTALDMATDTWKRFVFSRSALRQTLNGWRLTNAVNVNKLYDDFADLGWDYTAGRMSPYGML